MKRPLAITVAVAVVLALAGGIWWWTQRSGEPDLPTTVGTPGQGEAAANALEQLETDPAALLPAELVGQLDGDVNAAIPAGTAVEADPATWQPSAAGGGVIEVHLTFPDGTTQTVAAVMAEEQDGWKVLQTIPMEPAP